MGVGAPFKSFMLNLLSISWVYLAWLKNVPPLTCLISKPRNTLNSPIIDIRNLLVICFENSSLKALLDEPKIISSTYIWHTKSSPLTFLVTKSGIDFPNVKPTIKQQLSKVHIPRVWVLFEPIEHFIKFVDMVWEVGILKSQGLIYIYQLIQWTIKECTFYIHLLQLKVMMCCIS